MTTTKPPTTKLPAPHHAGATLTGAELQTLREACAMTREDLADLANVQARTIKHWENARSSVPADVAELVRQLDTALDACAGAELDALRWHWAPGGTVVLMRFKTAQELREHIKATSAAHQNRGHDAAALWRSVPFCAAGAVVLRVAMLWRYRMQEQGGTPQALQLARVVWFDAATYAEWLTVHNQPDSEDARVAWAGDALAVQTIPHRPTAAAA